MEGWPVVVGRAGWWVGSVGRWSLAGVAGLGRFGLGGRWSRLAGLGGSPG